MGNRPSGTPDRGGIGSRLSAAGRQYHQLLVHARVPGIENNSCAAVALQANSNLDLPAMKQVWYLVLDEFEPDSDPSLCLAQI